MTKITREDLRKMGRILTIRGFEGDNPWIDDPYMREVTKIDLRTVRKVKPPAKRGIIPIGVIRNAVKNVIKQRLEKI